MPPRPGQPLALLDVTVWCSEKQHSTSQRDEVVAVLHILQRRIKERASASLAKIPPSPCKRRIMGCLELPAKTLAAYISATRVWDWKKIPISQLSSVRRRSCSRRPIQNEAENRNIPQRSSEPQATRPNAFRDSQRLSEWNSTKNPVAQPRAVGDALYALVGPATVPLACQ